MSKSGLVISKAIQKKVNGYSYTILDNIILKLYFFSGMNGPMEKES